MNGPCYGTGNDPIIGISDGEGTGVVNKPGVTLRQEKKESFIEGAGGAASTGKIEKHSVGNRRVKVDQTTVDAERDTVGARTRIIGMPNSFKNLIQSRDYHLRLNDPSSVVFKRFPYMLWISRFLFPYFAVELMDKAGFAVRVVGGLIIQGHSKVGKSSTVAGEGFLENLSQVSFRTGDVGSMGGDVCREVFLLRTQVKREGERWGVHIREQQFFEVFPESVVYKPAIFKLVDVSTEEGVGGKDGLALLEILRLNLSLLIEPNSSRNKLLLVQVCGTKLESFRGSASSNGGEKLILTKGVVAFCVARPVIKKALLEGGALSNPSGDD